MTSASGAMRLMSPVRTRPGPISTKVVTPAAVIRSTARTQSTPAVRCSTSSVRHASAVSIGRASALARSGTVGSWNVMPARAARIPSAASAMSGEWAATETGRTMARLAPSDLASSAPASMAGRSPETTTWPGALRLATTKTPCASARLDQLGESRVVEADERRHRAVAALARGLHQPATLADEPDAVLEVERAGRDERRVLAHRVAGRRTPGSGRRGPRRPSARAAPRGSRSRSRGSPAGRSRSGRGARPGRPRRAR